MLWVAYIPSRPASVDRHQLLRDEKRHPLLNKIPISVKGVSKLGQQGNGVDHPTKIQNHQLFLTYKR